MFSIGDRVVHPMHGAGIIEAIVREKINGCCREYYVFRMPFGGLILKIPVANCAATGLRAIAKPEEVDLLLEKIPLLDTEMTANWNQRYRENLARVKSGDLYQVARVIKGLMRRDSLRGLSTGERKMLHSAKQIFISEIVLTKSEVYDEVERRVNEAMLAKTEKECI